MENTTIIERITAKKVFKGSKIKVMITTVTNTSIGYDIIDTENPDYVISDVENVIAPELVGYPASNQDFIDSLICNVSVDDTRTTMGVSISVARSAANSMDIPLFKHLGGALITELPIVGCSLLSDKEDNKLIAIPMVDSIGEIVLIYDKILNRLSDIYEVRNMSGEFVCEDVFNEINTFKSIIENIKEEEDVEILVGGRITRYDERVNELDYLECDELVEFDGFLCVDGVYEEADFSKINPYEMGTITEMYYYINYILEKGVYPTIFGNNSSFSHIGVGFKVPFLRADIGSNVLNELWNIERSLSNPNVRRF
ncbi:hypothetical protein [Methanotorris formicicus]|uniref:Enolase-like protein n=1 Tax=Methanotorris formicicus Mc-S-70 TaxID=647171 RepID=H1KXZ1_9EURY|nr:hypothetical protein [Methanotorris formicicus]EHP87775.1 Enolase-like protein [Methanotorris formicicus Mc-S-70]